MSIDARVKTVFINEDGSGRLELEGRIKGERPGQSVLCFDKAPEEVTALNGLEIWGNASTIMLGDAKIAVRKGYTNIEFCPDDEFKHAVSKYHQKVKDDVE